MMTRPTIVLLALALACGGSDEPEDATEVGTAGAEEVIAPPPLDPLALLPAESLGVTTIDLGRLRASPYYATFHGWLDLLPDLTHAQREAAERALANAEIAHIATVDRPCSSKCWTLGSVYVAGPMDPATANATLQQFVRGDRFAPREVAGLPAFGDAQGAMVTVEDGKYLLGPTQYIEPPLRQARRPHAESNAAVASALAALGSESTLRGWVVGDATTRAVLARETPFSTDVTELMQGAAFRVDLANGLILEVVATATDPNAAAALSAALRREVDALTGSLPARAMGLGVLGTSTQIAVEGASVRATLRLDDAQFRSLLGRADSLLRLVN